MRRPNLRPLSRSLGPVALSLLLCAGAHAGTEVAPYFYTWGFGNGAYKVKTLMDAKSQAGMVMPPIFTAVRSR